VDAPRVISDDYRRLQQALHDNPAYGVSSVAFAPLVKALVERTGARTVMDYGAGKRRLRDELVDRFGLPIDYLAYDPAFPEYGPPRPADLVCCIDVLEHIEPDFLDAVLDELAVITVRQGFFTVHTGPAKKALADGRNAHLIQQPSAWWLEKLKDRFSIDHLHEPPGGFYVVVSPRKTG
jgi:hypothetical protein